MKRSRNDQILACVNHYLRHRQFMDFSNLSEKKGHTGACDMKEYTLSQAAKHSDASCEAISFSSIASDAVMCEQQFSRFKSYVLDSMEPYHRELVSLLYPLFVHFFLELINTGNKQPAQKFFLKHQALFVESDENKPLMAMLATINSKEDLRVNKLINEFSEKRYHVSVSEQTFQHLLNFFNKDDCMLCLQILSRHTDVSVTDDMADVVTRESRDDLMDCHTAGGGSPVKGPLSSQGLGGAGLESGLSTLQRIIHRVEHGTPPLPSICLYSLQHSSSRCVCVSMCDDDSMLSAGFDDSSVLVCPLQAQQPRSAQRSGMRSEVKVRVSQVHLAGDHCEDVQQKLNSIEGGHDELFSSLMRYGVSEEGSVLHAHSDIVYSTRFMHGSTLLLSASADNSVRLWDVESCNNIVKYIGHCYPVFDIDVSEVTHSFVSCSYDQTARLWCTDRIFPLRVFIGHTRGVNCVRFHPNSTYLATGSSDGTARMWSVQDSQPVRLLQGHRGLVTAVAFSPNGKYLATAGEDKRVKVWDLASGTLFKDLIGHTDVVYSLAFNNQNSLLASGGLDGTVRLWDTRQSYTSSARTGEMSSSELLATYHTKCSSVLGLKFSQRNFLQAMALQQ